MKDPRARALRDRGETAIKSFLTFLVGALLLIVFAKFLHGLPEIWPAHFGDLADPMERVLSLADPKPVFALQALTLLLRSGALVTNRWEGSELLFDALDALYAVTFSLLGFLVGGGCYLAIFQMNFALLIEPIALTIMASVVLVGLDLAELKMTLFLHNSFYRLALAFLYFFFAAVALLANK